MCHDIDSAKFNHMCIPPPAKSEIATMLLLQNFWKRSNPVAARLAFKLFDQRILANQFRTAYLVEMIEPILQRSGWCAGGERGASWDFEHSEGCHLKVMQSAALQIRSKEHRLEPRPVFNIRPRQNSASQQSRKLSARTSTSADIYLIGWHPVQSLDEVDHREPTQWQFFVLPSRAIPEDQKSIGLARVRGIAGQQGGGPVSYLALAGAIEGYRLRLRAETAVRANEAVVAGAPDWAPA
jgi:hypothetical protein